MTLPSTLAYLATASAVGAIAGWIGKLAQDWLSAEKKRRDALESYVIDHIAEFAPTYLLLANYAELVALALIRYLLAKRALQLGQLTSDAAWAEKYLESIATDIARQVLFWEAKLYRTIYEAFLNKGGQYYLRDDWASDAINKLHWQMVERLAFRPEVIGKYVGKDTELFQFYDALEAQDGPDNDSLRQEERSFVQWLRGNDLQARELAAFALAYKNVFNEQLGNLRYARVRRGGKRPDSVVEIDRGCASSAVPKETRELAVSAATYDAVTRAQWARLLDGVARPGSQRAFSELFNLGWSAYQQGSYDVALEQYEKLLETVPLHPDVHNNIGNVRLAKGDYAGAEEKYRRAIELEAQLNLGTAATPAFFANLGAVLLKTGLDAKDGRLAKDVPRVQEAIGCYQRAVQCDPASSTRCNDLGNALYSAELFQEAADAYRAAIARSSGDYVLHANLAGALDAQGALDEALSQYEIALRLSPDDAAKAGIQAEIAKLRSKAGKQDVEAAWRAATELDPNQSSYHVSLAYVFFNAGSLMPAADFERAVESCRRDANAALGHSRAGTLFFEQARTSPDRGAGLYEHAISEYDLAVHAEPTNARYWYQLGLAYRKLMRLDRAIDCYHRAIELDPAALRYRRDLGLVYHAGRWYDEALPLLKAVLDAGEDVDCALALAQCYAFKANPELQLAVTLCNSIIAKHPDDYRTYQCLGTILQRPYPARALTAYKTALAKVPDSQLGEVLAETRQTCEAAIAAHPQDAQLYGELGRVLTRCGAYDDAAEAYRKALALDDSHDPLLRAGLAEALGNVFFRKPDYQRSRDQWNAALELLAEAAGTDVGDRRARLLNNLGTAYDGIGDADEALRCYSAALELSRSNAVGHYNVGLAKYRRQAIAEALGYFQEAWRLMPNLAQPPYQIGNCYWNLGYADLAEERWVLALSLDPGLAEASFNAGMAAYARGDREGALSRWRQALSAKPDLDLALKAIDAAEHAQPVDPAICQSLFDPPHALAPAAAPASAAPDATPAETSAPAAAG